MTKSMTIDTPLLSILIVNYNGFTFLDDCIQSITTHVSMPHEIVIVDNASTDQSVSHIQAKHPGVVLITNSENLGFAKGNNLGAQHARGKYILLLNNDTILCSDIKPGIEILDSHASIGIVGAKMHGRNMEYRHSARHFPAPHRLFKFSTRLNKKGAFKSGDFDNDAAAYHFVDYIEGSFLLTTRHIWNILNGLDENLFMYGEDLEFCYRAKKKGYATVFLPTIKYIHYGGFNPGREYLVIAGIKYFYKKWSSPQKYALACSILYIRLLLRLLFYSVYFLFSKRHHDKITSSAFALKYFSKYHVVNEHK